MATYSTSALTKMKLIMAAGELYAEFGIPHVTVRAIAKRSGENMGSITYHFKDKDGLIESVLDFATEKWQKDPFGSFLKKNSALFDNIAGQRKFIINLVNLFIETLFDKEKPDWCERLVFQVFQGNLPVSQRLFEKSVLPIINAFTYINERIAGKHDPANALSWMMITLSPMHLLSIDRSISMHLYKKPTFPSNIIDILKKMAIKSSLVNSGLWDNALEKEFNNNPDAFQLSE